MPFLSWHWAKQIPISQLWWLDLNYLIIFLFFRSISKPSHTVNSRDFLTTGINQINRTFCLTTNSTPKDVCNTWSFLNCSTNMCQSDTSLYITLKQQGWNLQSLELPYLHLTGGLEDTWKTFSWSGVKIEMAPNLPLFQITSLKHENISIALHRCQIS